MKTKIYFIFIFLAITLSGLYAQDNVTVTDVITGKSEVKARQSITLGAGFHAVAGSNFRAYIDANAVDNSPVSETGTILGASPTGSASTALNYVRSITFREAHSTMPTGNFKHMEEISYYDGLGRPVQAIQVGASPTGKDIIQPIVYDAFGREAKKYLPYVVADNNGAFVGDAEQGCLNFYKSTSIAGKINDDMPYAETLFENSPLNRVEGQFGAGKAWHDANSSDPNKGKTKINYTTNSNYTVTSWDENGTAFQYPTSSLYITETTDENGNVSREYKDKLGQVVLKESVNGAETLKTYYIYDDFGLLRTVVPPLADSPTDSSLCYYYTYDGRKRMISKKIPGADIVYMVYDNRDRLVLTQDGNMRAESANKYMFTKYDCFNRPVMTGTLIANKSLGEIRDEFKAHDGNPTTEKMFETFDKASNSSTYGYTLNDSYPSACKGITTDNILTITWYDDYDFLSLVTNGDKMEFDDFRPSGTGYVSTASTKTKGVATGSMTKVLPVANSGLTMANTRLVTVSYFDDYGNVIKAISSNHMGGYDAVHSKYEAITYQVLETEQVHTVENQPALTVIKRFEYDHAGRLLQVKSKINNEDEIVLNESKYNELGELVEKYLHSSETTSSTSPKSFTQKVDYTYNIRGWLTAINDPDLSGGNDLFGMKLYYNKLDGLTADRVTGGAQYNGNISAMVCSNAGDAVQTRGYGFTYDAINRLKGALYGEGTNLSANKDKYNLSNVAYDKNGNIERLQRYFNGSLADDLTYNYQNNHKSNRLQKVSDPVGDISDMADYSVKSALDYDYDSNGNMKFDPGKGTNIKYNFLNLPQEIVIDNNRKIFYHYDAAGRKLAKYVSNQGTYTTTDYVANLVYTNKQKSFFSTEEGRAIPVEENGTTRWHYEYNLKDHLGNTRVTFGGSNLGGATDIVQTSTYYPFGMVQTQNNYNTGGNNYQLNKYLYNGKELQNDDLGGVSLDWYDYGARFYDASLGRWHCIDPLAEKYDMLSPYNYCINNPIRYIDPDGLDGMVTGSGTKDDPYVIKATYYYENGSLNDDQVSALNGAVDSYNNLGGEGGVKIKNADGSKSYVKYNLSAEGVDDVDKARANTQFETTSGETRYYGNKVGTEPIESGHGEEFGAGNNIRVDFNQDNIDTGVNRDGYNKSSLMKGVMIHEIGHNLGGEHVDGTNTMITAGKDVRTSQTSEPSTIYTYPQTSKRFTQIIFQRRDTPKSDSSDGRVWTKK